MITIIVAMAQRSVIGSSNDLPWYLPADLKRFKDLTTGHTVVMGRKTFDSILERLHRPLPNRTNVVVTRDRTFSHPGVEVAHSINSALDRPEDVYVIGGAQIYEQALPRVDMVQLTEVKAAINGDTFFPELDPEQWQEITRESHQADDKNPYDYDFVTLRRKN